MQVIQLLNKYGAKRDRYLSDMVSHVIADSKTDDYSEAKELFELPIVKVCIHLYTQLIGIVIFLSDLLPPATIPDQTTSLLKDFEMSSIFSY